MPSETATDIDCYESAAPGLFEQKPLGMEVLQRMEQFIGCDVHKKFSVFVTVNEKGNAPQPSDWTHDFSLRR
jgi:hypothetical protein